MNDIDNTIQPKNEHAEIAASELASILDNWYFKAKERLKHIGPHNLGFEKELFKTQIIEIILCFINEWETIIEQLEKKGKKTNDNHENE